MQSQLIDPVTGIAHAARGADGHLTVSQPADGSLIQPDDLIVYDPPIMVWIGDATAQTVTVVPYGRNGDRSVQYPTAYNFLVPVMAKQVLATGTTASVVRAQAAYTGVNVPASFNILAEDGTPLATEAGARILTENAP